MFQTIDKDILIQTNQY